MVPITCQKFSVTTKTWQRDGARKQRPGPPSWWLQSSAGALGGILSGYVYLDLELLKQQL